MSRYLDKSWKVSTNLKNLVSRNLSRQSQKNLDAANSRLKSLDFKNLKQKKKVDLDMMDILNSFQKLVLIDREISISICLDRRDPQA